MDLNTFVLSTLLAFNITAINNKDQAAYTNASTAVYKASGLEKNIQILVDKHTSPELRYYTGNVVFVMRTLTEQKITYEFQF